MFRGTGRGARKPRQFDATEWRIRSDVEHTDPGKGEAVIAGSGEGFVSLLSVFCDISVVASTRTSLSLSCSVKGPKMMPALSFVRPCELRHFMCFCYYYNDSGKAKWNLRLCSMGSFRACLEALMHFGLRVTRVLELCWG